jgi:diguanylate cyclase (GGDEF)-like protein
MAPTGKTGRWWLAALAACLFCVHSVAARADDQITDAHAFLDQTEAIRITDHAQFVQRLKRIHQSAVALTDKDRWYLRYLDAWEAMFEGNYPDSREQFEQIIRDSHDPLLAAKSSALLVMGYAVNHDYGKAVELANRLSAQLPQIPEGNSRQQVLGFLSQGWLFIGQVDLGLKYARMMLRGTPAGESTCYPQALEVFALSFSNHLASDSNELKSAIDSCVKARMEISLNALRLIQADRFLAEKHPAQTIATLDRIDARIQASKYKLHMIWATTTRARAEEQLEHDDLATQAAQKALAIGGLDGVSEWQRDAYGVLYRVAKRKGNTAAALDYHEHYVKQDRGYLDDVSARNLAFQLAKQQSVLRQLETEGLRKENSILKLQQALDAKAAETSRLYIALLLVGLTGIALLLFRTIRSQLRFKRMAIRDGLTGIHNHQNFIGECETRLLVLKKRLGHACLIWIDLDHFKQINDTHGHAIGDAALKHSVTICQQQLRPGDLIGRLGGEEFGILLGDCPREQAIAIADRIRLAIESHPMALDGAVVSLSASIGVASTVTSGHDLQRLCRDADAALYRAKRTGRNRVVADAADSGFVEA